MRRQRNSLAWPVARCPDGRLYRHQGESGLNARPKGRSPHPALKEGQAAMVVELVSCHSPDQLGLPFPLDSRGRGATDQ